MKNAKVLLLVAGGGLLLWATMGKASAATSARPMGMAPALAPDSLNNRSFIDMITGRNSQSSGASTPLAIGIDSRPTSRPQLPSPTANPTGTPGAIPASLGPPVFERYHFDRPARMFAAQVQSPIDPILMATPDLQTGAGYGA